MTDAPEWKKQLASELLRKPHKKFTRRSVFSPKVDSIWTADLADIHKYSTVNNDYNFILVILDVFSRFAWALPIKNKTATEVANAFESVFNSGAVCQRLWTDRGREFYNRKAKKLFADRGVTLYSTHNEPKAMIAERFIRTLRKKIEENFILTDSTVWYNALDRIISEYNNHGHRYLHGMSPIDARKPENAHFVYKCQFEKKYTEKDRSPVYSVGDTVRISLVKQLFEKDSTASWSEEIFKIRELVFTDRVLYKLEDMTGEPLDGNFYPEQLQLTNQSIYRVDSILQRRVRNGVPQVYVKWTGYSSKFNSWEPADAVLHSQQNEHWH